MIATLTLNQQSNSLTSICHVSVTFSEVTFPSRSPQSSLMPYIDQLRV